MFIASSVDALLIEVGCNFQCETLKHEEHSPLSMAGRRSSKAGVLTMKWPWHFFHGTTRPDLSPDGSLVYLIVTHDSISDN